IRLARQDRADDDLLASMRRRPAGILALSALSAFAVTVTGGPSAQATEPTIVEFTYTGAPETWDVPDGVTEITATACGAQGGTGVTTTYEDDVPGEAGGLGGCATAVLSITPGETLTVVVGGQGDAHPGSSDPPTSATSTGGYNGGADGGQASATAII